MEEEVIVLSKDEINARFSKLEREIKGIKEEQTKLSKHQKEIEDKIKGKLGWIKEFPHFSLKDEKN